MEIQDLLNFLTPDNRERLTLIGSGVATVAGAIWIVTKAYFGRQGRDKTDVPKVPAAFQVNRSKALSNYGNQSGIANVSGNVSVVQTIGTTVSKISVVVLFIGLLLVALAIATNWFISSGAEAAELPRVDFNVGCGENEADIQSILNATPSEARSIAEILKIGNQYRNQIIYAKVLVDQPCGMCECYRLDAKNALDSKRAIKYDADKSIGYIEMKWAPEAEDVPLAGGNLMISTMIYEEMAATYSILLPAAGQIPRNGLYSNDTVRSTVISYSGPFFVEENYDTGWGYVKLTPITIVDDDIRRRLRCSQPDLSWRSKLADRCGPVPSPVDEEAESPEVTE